MITISRIVASPFLALAIANDLKTEALCGCLLAGFSDWLDGYIARNFNQATVLGGFLDPLADKIVIGSLTIGLCAKELIPFPLAAIIIGRDLALIAGSFVMRYLEIPKGAPFFDTTYSATFHITPNPLGKLNTVIQFSLLSATLCHFATDMPDLLYLQPLWYLTAGTTITSGLMYVAGNGLTRMSKARKTEEHVVDKDSNNNKQEVDLNEKENHKK
eukprot:CAMPEP_0182417286 /NCGR_PEP_ID=MMETSP1167-20130531/1718_1 /TAXON_ID=2988 /ORGANISM="Mallomonas Sp, Strain CCMP3275" /LENGTH=215 /DNA_ID=CAMNT_0024590715 /DNA_START=372 /DNA_END=1019 /DNA_ORIENTATION=+